MQNGIFTTSWKAIGESVLTAIVAAILVYIVGIVGSQGFSLFAVSWGQVGQAAINLGFIAGVTTLGKDLLSTNQGSLLGIGPIAG